MMTFLLNLHFLRVHLHPPPPQALGSLYTWRWVSAAWSWPSYDEGAVPQQLAASCRPNSWGGWRRAAAAGGSNAAQDAAQQVGGWVRGWGTCRAGLGRKEGLLLMVGA
jgi:hypothetical protein